jgi:type IV pilus assembly protein PilF
MSASFVVCQFCGARIRADRTRCLRCGEELQAASPAPQPGPTLRDWLQTSTPRNLAVGALASLGVLAGVVMLDTQSRSGGVARVGGSAKPAATAASPVRMAASRPLPQGELMAPATASDSVRLAGAAFTSGDFEAAKLRYEQALQKKADDPEALNGLGLVFERQGAFDDAVARFARAAAAVPTSWTYRFNLAHALGESGKWDQAVDEYRSASGLFPDDYATEYNLALALHKKGDDEGAIPEFRKAIALAPREPSFHLSLAMSLEKTGKTADAAREYEQYLAMAPWVPEADKIKEHLKAIGAAQSGDAKRPSAP